MTIIEASSYTSRVLVDGTLAMVIHIDPKMRDAAMKLFGAPGTPMGIAALRTAKAETPKPEPKRGLLSQWAAMRCDEPEFQRWIGNEFPWAWHCMGDLDAEGSASVMRKVCDITSRAELDSNKVASATFHKKIRAPWNAHCKHPETA